MASLDSEWEAYKATHNKKYDAEEDEMRKKTYYENKKKVEEHNKRYAEQEETFEMGINQFSDQLPHEISKGCCGVRMPEKKE